MAEKINVGEKVVAHERNKEQLFVYWKTWFREQWQQLIDAGFSARAIAQAWQVPMTDNDMNEGTVSSGFLDSICEEKALEKVLYVARRPELSVADAWFQEITDEWNALVDHDMKPREIAAVMGIDADLFIGEDGVVDDELKDEAFRYEAGKRKAEEDSFASSADSTMKKRTIAVVPEFLPKGVGPVRPHRADRKVDYHGAPRKAWTRELLHDLKYAYTEIPAAFGTTEVFYVPSLKKAIAVDDQPNKATYILFGVDELALTDWLSVHRVTAHGMALDPAFGQYQLITWFGDKDKWQNEIKKVLSQDAPVKKVRKERYRGEKILPPAGWLSLFGVSKNVDADRTVIKAFVDAYRIEHPEWFAFYWSGNQLVEYFHPELNSMIERTFAGVTKGRELRRKGWKTVTQLVETFGNYYKVINQLNIYRQTFPHLFYAYFSGQRRFEVIHPDIEVRVKEFFAQEPVRPPNVLTMSELEREFQGDRHWIARAILDYAKEFEPLIQHVGKKNYYDKACVEVLRQLAARRQEAPPGWMTERTATKSFGVSVERFREFAAQQKEMHPEWTQIFWWHNNDRIFFHPDLLAAFRATLPDRPRHEPLPGWKSNNTLGKLLHVGTERLSEVIEPFRPTHPDWFDSFWVNNGFYEHYSPELVSELVSLKDSGRLVKKK